MLPPHAIGHPRTHDKGNEAGLWLVNVHKWPEESTRASLFLSVLMWVDMRGRSGQLYHCTDRVCSQLWGRERVIHIMHSVLFWM